MKKLFLILLTSFTLYSCENNDDKPTNPIDQLPPETQTGAGTFGCLINGVAFIIKNTSQQFAIYQKGQLQFGAQGISMILGDPLIENVNYSLIGQSQYLVNFNPQLGCHYEFDDSYKGNIIFTKIDKVNFIISGTFEFSTVTENCENINITEGRFDLQYIP